MTMSFFFCLSAVITMGNRYHFLSAFQTTEQRIHHLDREIEDLEEKKRGFESQAIWHEEQAERLQFDEQRVLETRRHIRLAEEKRAMAEKMQEGIDRLQEEKTKLVRLQKGSTKR